VFLFVVMNQSSKEEMKMLKREVTHSGKNPEGDITALCNPDASWSPRFKHDAIQDIERGDYSYFVDISGVGSVDIHVVPSENGKYLRTDPDQTTRNNLDELPDC
jgi:hypothetical protein